MWPFCKKPRERIRGAIGYFGLDEWWLATFTEAEREYIESIYHPFGDPNPRPLTEGGILSTTQTAAGLLNGLATWFKRGNDRHIAHRLLAKAEAMAGSDILDRHFSYQGMIQTYYPDRDRDPRALPKTIRACEKQIALAPKAAKAFKEQYRGALLPHHVGFTQLAILREKEGAYAEAMQLSRVAMKQGWAGDWGKRIARCEAKLRKKNPGT